MFENQIKRISSKDEIKVLSSIGPELEKLKDLAESNQSHKIENLIQNAELLLKILTEKDFPLTDSTRKWIVFGLGYLISEVDLIPDAIPYIGYNDDSLILQWVIYMIDKDISRYNVFIKSKIIAESGGILQDIYYSESNKTDVILIPGLLNLLQQSDNLDFWKNELSNTNIDFKNSNFKILNWNISHLREFTNVIRIIDHQLTLKPSFDSDEFGSEWQQAKAEFILLGKAMTKDIEEIKSKSQDQRIILISFDLGCISSDIVISKLPKNTISQYYSIGGVTSVEDLPNDHYSKIDSIHNFFSSNDLLLKFIFDNFEKYRNPVGLSPFIMDKNDNIKNFNVSDKVNNHCDFKTKISDYLA